MNFSEKWGKNVDEAVALALKEFNANIEDVEVTVLEEPSKGFLGLGSKLAKVRVELKSEKSVAKLEPIVKSDKETNTDHKKNYEKMGKRSNVLVQPEDLEDVLEHPALDFIKETTAKMDLDLSITARLNKENIYIDIQGKDAGTIIGKRGQTLDAIQYLTSLVVNKGREDYLRVVVDAENYREKREKTLEQLAERLASKVAKTGRRVRLEPMNPYERMVIHSYLHDNPKVKTGSEGEEPYRRVVIEPK